jgi:glycosyltransferase involved in cell wall biosynthesis
MKILFCVRPDLISTPGGDTIQILKTKDYLERLNISVDVILNTDSIHRRYDLAHLFNIIRVNSLFDYVKHLVKKNIPYVISPIYWDTSEYESKVLNRISRKRKLYSSLKKITPAGKLIETFFKLFPGDRLIEPMTNSKIMFCLENSKLILPNSYIEKIMIEKNFHIRENCFVVPNGIDENIIPDEYKKIKSRFNLPDAFICSVGRIEYRKNQLQTIKAARELGINLILIGNINKREIKYWKECKKLFDNNTTYISYLTHEELYSIYQNALSHILPSWFETPGLVSLEAGFNGCQIVTSKKGSTCEYFNDYAFYCEPDNYETIKSAIKESLIRPKNLDGLKDRILQKYTWKHAAEVTSKSYEWVLSRI